MPVLKRRSRLVTFRVSAEEYRDLSSSCLETDARSIAEFSRAAVLDRVQSTRHRAGTLSGDLATLSRSLAELDSVLVEARRKIRTVLGNVHADNGDGSIEA